MATGAEPPRLAPPVYSVDAMALMYMTTVLVILLIALRFVRPTQMVFRLDQPAR